MEGILLAGEGCNRASPSSRYGVRFFSPYFIVPKKSCGLRPILDLRGLNLVLHKLTFDAEMHFRVHPSPRLVCSNRPEGRVLSCLDPPATQAIPVSKQRMAHWIVDAITLAYEAQSVPCPLRLPAHSTRGVALSWALARGASLVDICRAACWATPNTSARFYSLRVEPVSSYVLTSSGKWH